MSHPARGAWIEILTVFTIHHGALSSHPARGAWIEIDVLLVNFVDDTVAPREGCVD